MDYHEHLLLFGEESDRPNIRLVNRQADNAEIDAPCAQQLNHPRRAAHRQLEAHTRVNLPQMSDVFRKLVAQARNAQAELKLGADGSLTTKVPFGRRYRLKDLLCVVAKPVPFFGEEYLRPHARKEGRSDLTFQSFDVIADSGLRQTQLRGGPGKTSRFHNRPKHLELVQVHRKVPGGSSL